MGRAVPHEAREAARVHRVLGDDAVLQAIANVRRAVAAQVRLIVDVAVLKALIAPRRKRDDVRNDGQRRARELAFRLGACVIHVEGVRPGPPSRA